MSMVDALKQHLPEWPGFRPAEWFRKRREAAAGDERVPIRDWVDAGRPARVMGVDSALIWVTASLLAFGLVMVYSASVALPDSPRFALYTPTHFLSRQSLFIAIGVVCAFATAQIPIAVWEKWAPWIFGLVLALLRARAGAARRQGGQRLAPLDRDGPARLPAQRGRQARDVHVRGELHGAQDGREGELHQGRVADGGGPRRDRRAAAGRADMGAFMVIAAIALGVLFLGGVNGRMFLLSVAVLLGAFTLMIVFSEFRRQRIFAYLDPWNPTYAQGKAYQLTHSLIAFGRGELFGQGLGSSIEKLHYLPEAHTDFLLAVIGEELGFVGVSIIVLAFFWLTRRLFIIGRQAIALDRVFAGLMCQGVGLWMGAQSFINFGVNLGVLPTKGLTLPLLSYGGSGVVLNLVALALVLRVDMESRALMRGGRT